MAAPVRRESLQEFARRKLLARQRSLLERHSAAVRDAQQLYEEREPEPEDRAAEVTAAQNLDRIGDNELAQLGRVIAALARIEDGTWGHCRVCGGPISARRLRAVPEATRCSSCTDHE